jgi:hypothetical protein
MRYWDRRYINWKPIKLIISVIYYYSVLSCTFHSNECRPVIIYYFLWLCSPARAVASSFTRFLDQTQRRATVDSTPLDEWSVYRRDLYLTTYNTHNRQTSMPPVEFESTIAAGERPQTYALDRAANGGRSVIVNIIFNLKLSRFTSTRMLSSPKLPFIRKGIAVFEDCRFRPLVFPINSPGEKNLNMRLWGILLMLAQRYSEVPTSQRHFLHHKSHIT